MSHSPVAVASRPRPNPARLSLQADGLLVAAAGVVLLVRASPLASAMGFAIAWPLLVLGAGCVLYGAWLLRTATRASSEGVRRLAATIAAGNAVWVVAGAAILLVGIPSLTATGRWVMAAQAGAVALLAAAQALAVRRTV